MAPACTGRAKSSWLVARGAWLATGRCVLTGHCRPRQRNPLGISGQRSRTYEQRPTEQTARGRSIKSNIRWHNMFSTGGRRGAGSGQIPEGCSTTTLRRFCLSTDAPKFRTAEFLGDHPLEHYGDASVSRPNLDPMLAEIGQIFVGVAGRCMDTTPEQFLS